jgi:hypothetical protein
VRVVVIFEPAKNDRGIEAAGISQNDLHECLIFDVRGLIANPSP